MYHVLILIPTIEVLSFVMSSLLSTEIHHQNNLKKLAPHNNSTHSFNFIFAHKGFVCTELLLIMFLLLVIRLSQDLKSIALQSATYSLGLIYWDQACYHLQSGL